MQKALEMSILRCRCSLGMVAGNKAPVVDVSAGGYVIADTPLDAFARGWERYPEGVLYLVPAGAGAEEG